MVTIYAFRNKCQNKKYIHVYGLDCLEKIEVLTIWKVFKQRIFTSDKYCTAWYCNGFSSYKLKKKLSINSWVRLGFFYKDQVKINKYNEAFNWLNNMNLLYDFPRAYSGYLIVEQLTKNQNAKSTSDQLTVDCGF